MAADRIQSALRRTSTAAATTAASSSRSSSLRSRRGREPDEHRASGVLAEVEPLDEATVVAGEPDHLDVGRPERRRRTRGSPCRQTDAERVDRRSIRVREQRVELGGPVVVDHHPGEVEQHRTLSPASVVPRRSLRRADRPWVVDGAADHVCSPAKSGRRRVERGGACVARSSPRRRGTMYAPAANGSPPQRVTIERVAV